MAQSGISLNILLDVFAQKVPEHLRQIRVNFTIISAKLI